ncbi:MAG: hypothetical protein Q9164_005445 [Protoblastenia rupestris]
MARLAMLVGPSTPVTYVRLSFVGASCNIGISYYRIDSHKSTLSTDKMCFLMIIESINMDIDVPLPPRGAALLTLGEERHPIPEGIPEIDRPKYEKGRKIIEYVTWKLQDSVGTLEGVSYLGKRIITLFHKAMGKHVNPSLAVLWSTLDSRRGVLWA